jgi:carbonic anhydrase
LTLKHISNTVQQLIKESEAIEQWVRNGNIQLVGAIYEPKTGIVEFLNTGTINHISTSELKGVR